MQNNKKREDTGYHRRKIVRNVIYLVLFVVAVYLQIKGHADESYTGLAIQFLSLFIFLGILASYNHEMKKLG